MKKHLIKNSIVRDFVKKNIIILIMLLFILIIIFFSEYERTEFSKNFPNISIKENINAKVIKKYKLDDIVSFITPIRDSPYCVIILTSTNKKNNICNFNVKINELMEEGDSIMKHKGSDTIYVYKKYSDAKTYDYFFIIDTVKY